MLFATLQFEVKAGERERFAAAAREVMDQTRSEPGCVAYSFTADLEHPDRFHITEIWESEEAVAAHLAQPHAKKMLAITAEIATMSAAHIYAGDASPMPMNHPDSISNEERAAP
jgi:quinol monooxygenase YgiN